MQLISIHNMTFSLSISTWHMHYHRHCLKSVNTRPINTNRLIVPASVAAEEISCFHSSWSFSMMLRANVYQHHSHYTYTYYNQNLENVTAMTVQLNESSARFILQYL